MTPPPPVVQASDREAEVCQRLGAWLSAALDDPNAGEAFKADVRAWFEAGGDRMGSTAEGASDPHVPESDRNLRERVIQEIKRTHDELGLVDPEWTDACYNATIIADNVLALLPDRTHPVAFAPKGHIERYLKGKNTACWVYGTPTSEDDDALYLGTRPTTEGADTAASPNSSLPPRPDKQEGRETGFEPATSGVSQNAERRRSEEGLYAIVPLEPTAEMLAAVPQFDEDGFRTDTLGPAYAWHYMVQNAPDFSKVVGEAATRVQEYIDDYRSTPEWLGYMVRPFPGIADLEALILAVYRIKITTEGAGSASVGETLPASACHAVSDDAIKHLEIRSPLNRAIYKAIRDYRMSNMVDEDGYVGFPLVDLMSNPAPSDIGTGEMEMIALADDVCEAVELALRQATPSSDGWKKAVDWLREWSNGQPSEGLVARQNLSERDVEVMCVALAAAADTIEGRLSAAPQVEGDGV